VKLDNSRLVHIVTMGICVQLSANYLKGGMIMQHIHLFKILVHSTRRAKKPGLFLRVDKYAMVN